MRCKQHSGQPVDISPPENQPHDPVCSAENLELLRIGRYRFTLKAETSIHLPRYKGSTFHGGLGHALRQISPTYYRRLFEPDSNAKSSVPKPYVLVPPLDGLHEYAPGQQFFCELTLFGAANQCLPVCLAALEYFGSRMGVGREQGRFSVQGMDKIFPGGAVPANLIAQTAPPLRHGAVTLHLLTRLRLKAGGSLLNEAIPFAVLFARLLGRLDSLAHFHGKGKISTPRLRDELLDQARHIEIAESNLRWRNWDRFSGRQKQWMKFGGLMGSITYHGNLASFMPYLAVGEWVHIGGKTSFGLGKYLLET